MKIRQVPSNGLPCSCDSSPDVYIAVRAFRPRMHVHWTVASLSS